MFTKFDGLALRYECQEARLDEGLCDVSIDDAINIPTRNERRFWIHEEVSGYCD